MSIASVGAVCFGIVVGWITYRTLRRSRERVGVSDLAGVIAAIGGGAVTAGFSGERLFGWYSIGLAAGFFSYMILGHTLFRNSPWLGGDD